jgi:hypothetical protein
MIIKINKQREKDMSCYNSCVLSAEIDDVWKSLRNFHDMSWAKGVIESVEVVGNKGATEVGASRILNGAFHETLLELDDETYFIRYSIDDGPDAISKSKITGYRGEIQLAPVTMGEGTFIEWTSHWRTDEGGVEEFCDPIYQALLGAMSEHFDKQSKAA